MKKKLKDCYLYRGGSKTLSLIQLCNFIRTNLKTINCVGDIGCYAGESTMILHENMPTNVKIIAIDDYSINNFIETKRPNLEIELNNAEVNYNEVTRGIKRILKMKGNIESQILLDKIPDRHFDFVFLDTSENPEIILYHLEKIRSKVKLTGYICGDNYSLFEKHFEEKNFMPENVFNNDCWAKKL